MFITANKRESELIQEKERHRVTTCGVECGLARITRDRGMTKGVFRLLLRGICWRHVVAGYRLTHYTGKLCERTVVASLLLELELGTDESHLLTTTSVSCQLGDRSLSPMLRLWPVLTGTGTEPIIF